MNVLEKTKMGKLKREFLIPQYTRNTVNNSEVAFDTFTDNCLNSNLVKLTEVKLILSEDRFSTDYTIEFVFPSYSLKLS